jgi:hypothetical protein
VTIREHLEAIPVAIRAKEYATADMHAVAALEILNNARREVAPQGYRAVVPCRCVPDPEASS